MATVHGRKGYIRPIDYDELEDVFTKEELEVRLGI